jgi:hypothetical protein
MTILCIISHIGTALHHCTDWPPGFSLPITANLAVGVPPPIDAPIYHVFLSIYNAHFMYRNPYYSPINILQGSDYRPIPIKPYLYHVQYNLVCGCGNK